MAAIVETRDGRIEGTTDEGVLCFRGIPFAAPPVGALRFAAPADPEPWAGVRDATEFGPSAPQAARRIQILPANPQSRHDEDCLYLNVWTPAADAGKRPVLVWIHGGAFHRGDGSNPVYTGTRLAERAGVVLVTLNYRLGALGFLHLSLVGGDRMGAIANPGLLDQIAALRWVRDNIAALGGDPSNVTVFGESAGGMSVASLLGMPQAAGLFRRAIAQSGAAHNVHAEEAAARVAHQLLRTLDMPPYALDKLREVPPDKLLEAQIRVQVELRSDVDLLPFQPTVDPITLPRQPLEAVADGAVGDVPLIVGTNQDEWNFFSALDPKVAGLTEDGLRTRMTARLGEAAGPLLDVYARTRAGSRPGQRFCAIETDRVFRVPALRLAEAHARHSERTYSYLFSFTSPALDGQLGACHALDVPFVFGHTELPALRGLIGEGPHLRELSHQMMDAWTAFARSDSPAHAAIPTWAPYTTADRSTLIFDTPCRTEPDVAAEERRAWEGLL